MVLKDWTVIQNKNGFGSLDFDYWAPDEWLFNAQTEENKKQRREFTGLGVEVREEDSGLIINCDATVTQIGDREFNIKISRLPLGGLYTIGRKICFKNEENGEFSFDGSAYAYHVGVGDVFIIAGQSNAAGWGRGYLHEPAQLGISVLRTEGKWDIATHPFSGAGHSPFLTFAKTLYRYLNYPIGLIPRAIGGTPIDCWCGKNGMFIKPLKEEIKNENISAKAVLWYQGCSEGDKLPTTDYFDKFNDFVSQIREALNDETLPIYTFQLNKVRDEVNKDIREVGYSEIREIQRTIPQKIANTYVIPTIDAAIMSDEIHNAKASNVMLGDRLAYTMLDEIYHKLKFPKAPNIESANKTADNEITLTFSNMESISTFKVAPTLLPIRLVDEDGTLEVIDYSAEKNILKVVFNRTIKGTAFVSGMYGRTPIYWIIDSVSQLPVLCFNNVKVN